MPAGISATRGLWEEVCQIGNIQYIDPRNNVENIMKQLDQTRLLITEAMHGAIAAEAFRIPWISVYSGDHMNHNKWKDFCESLNLTYCPYQLPVTYRGNTELSFAKKCRETTKKILIASGFWKNRWMRPLPKKSTSDEVEQAVNRLLKISNEAEPVLSDQVLFENRLERLFDLLYKVKIKYNRPIL